MSELATQMLNTPGDIGDLLLDEVPHHGLTVGLGTIAKHSKVVAMVIHGGHKQYAARRLSESTAFDPQWPATIVHLCRSAAVFFDSQATGTASLGARRELDRRSR